MCSKTCADPGPPGGSTELLLNQQIRRKRGLGAAGKMKSNPNIWIYPPWIWIRNGRPTGGGQPSPSLRGPSPWSSKGRPIAPAHPRGGDRGPEQVESRNRGKGSRSAQVLGSAPGSAVGNDAARGRRGKGEPVAVSGERLSRQRVPRRKKTGESL